MISKGCLVKCTIPGAGDGVYLAISDPYDAGSGKPEDILFVVDILVNGASAMISTSWVEVVSQ